MAADDRVRRERVFHEARAALTRVDVGDLVASFEGSTTPENRFILARLGDVRGRTLLDLGCGAGEHSIYFAQRGARCVAVDCAPSMVEAALRLAERHGVTIEGRVADASTLDFPDDSVDIIYAANFLHHVDPEPALREIHRVLKPGGVAAMWDPLRHNPLINVYRRMATLVRSQDEQPLDIEIVRFTEGLFSRVEWDTFWLATLWIFLRFYLIERVDPNAEPYWKKIITDEPRLRPTYERLERVDRWLKRWPPLRRFAWNVAVVAWK
jgi:ubiquinone/menaquinone biosynthesis C-methylase UbiE